MSGEETSEREQSLVRMLIGDKDPTLSDHIRYLIRASLDAGETKTLHFYIPHTAGMQHGRSLYDPETPTLSSIAQSLKSKLFDPDVGTKETVDSSEEYTETSGSAVFDIFFEGCMAEMEGILRRMHRDREEIEQVKDETRNILANLHAA